MSYARSSLVEAELKRSITGHSGVFIYMGVRFDITRDTIRDTCQIESSHPILVRRTARNYDIHESSKNRSMKLKREKKYKFLKLRRMVDENFGIPVCNNNAMSSFVSMVSRIFYARDHS